MEDHLQEKMPKVLEEQQQSMDVERRDSQPIRDSESQDRFMSATGPLVLLPWRTLVTLAISVGW